VRGFHRRRIDKIASIEGEADVDPVCGLGFGLALGPLSLGHADQSVDFVVELVLGGRGSVQLPVTMSLVRFHDCARQVGNPGTLLGNGVSGR